MYLSFKSELIIYPSVAKVHVLYVPKPVSDKIIKKYGKGRFKVEAKIGKSTWITAIFPNKNSNGGYGHIFLIKKSIVELEKLSEGKTVLLKFKII